jgi:hypothetical protein
LIQFNAVFAQNQVDALRYSQSFYGGTAKSIAMGNSISAVGADMTDLTVNPAGIGVFKNSQMTFTPTFLVSNTDGTMDGNLRKDSRYDMSLNNWGIVGAFPVNKSIWKQFSFGFTYNRTNNFSQQFSVDGKNNTGSMLDYFVYNANHYYPGANGNIDRWSSFREELAWKDYLMNYDSANAEYYSDVTDANKYGELQRKVVTRRGGIGEYDFTFGGNLNNMFYFGGTMGITSVRYIESTYYKESGYNQVLINNVQMQPDNFDYTQDLTTTGTGFNFKFGALFCPVPFIRFGGAIHSSTFYNMHDVYKTTMSSAFLTPDENNNYDYYWDTDPNTFNWRLRTPFRADAGLAIVLDSYKMGGMYTLPMTFSCDYEYVDYSRAKLDADPTDYDFVNENIEIQNLYQPVQNLHFGAEVNLGVISLRAGYQIYGSPYKGDGMFQNATNGYSGGIGFNGKHVFLDLAYSVMTSKETYYLYDAQNTYPNDPIGTVYAPEPTASLKKVNYFANATFGVRF